MTFEERINDEYFDYLCELVDTDRFSRDISYRKLLSYLHDIEFTWIIPKDDNRADDGIQLRRRFSLFRGDVTLSNYIPGPCSVLEMMVALAIRCEESTMTDELLGNRTGQWFWGMIHNLELNSMIDSNFDINRVDYIIKRFLDREYEHDGKGGLFTVRNCKRDMRNVEIWYQLSWYLDSIS